MSATYNWAYKPGITNKYGLAVPAGADDERPSGWCYVALYGNDTTGNGSRLHPYKSITKAVSSGNNLKIVLGSGVYRELSVLDSFYTNTLIGDGDVVIDISYNVYLCDSFDLGSIYNIRFRGNGTTSYINSAYPVHSVFSDVFFDGCFSGKQNNYFVNYINCIVANFSGLILVEGGGFSLVSSNNTFINCNNIQFGDPDVTWNSNIFYACNIAIHDNQTANIRYSLFYNCNFKLDGYGAGGVLYPASPVGYVHYETIEDLQAAFLAIYSTQSFLGCKISDPLFNNLTIGDYTLKFASPAKNLSYFGTYVGARSIAQALKIKTVEADGDFDFSSAVNVTIADDSITLIDPALDAMIETKVIENTLGRQLKSIPIVGFSADRNGQYIDSIADLSAISKAAGDILSVPASYLVEVGAIAYNSAVYTAGQRFTTVTGQTTFTTATGGVLREILEAPQRHTIEMKLGDTQPFTTEAFNHFEPGITPTTNNTGDSRTGAILRGNGDPDFVRGSTIEFPVNSKYIKIRFIIRTNNLKP